MKIHIEREIGKGPETVYGYHFPGQFINNSPYPIKIGHAKRDAVKRVKEQQASMQEIPIIDLLIRCDDSHTLEQAIHNRLRDVNLPYYGSEWFNTTPEQIMEIWLSLQDVRNMSIGEQIRFLRKAKKMSQTDLAKAAGIRQETVSLVECGNTHAKLCTIQNIANELNMRLVLTPD